MESLDHSSVHIKRLVALALICVAVLQFALQVGSLAKGVEYIVTSLTIDDTYYYLQTAWNTKRLGFPTFDGIHPTNGVQLLWFWVIVLIAVFSPTKTVLLFITLIVCFLLNALCYLIIWRLGRLVQRPTLTMCMSLLWMVLSLGTDVYSTGMESSLHAFVFWCMVWQAAVFLVRVQRNERPNLLALTTVLVLNAWARIDAGLFSVVLYGFCVARALRSRNLRLSVWQDAGYVGLSVLLATLGLVIQLLAFWSMGESWLPVSALVKSSRQGWQLEMLKEWAGLAVYTVLPALGLLLLRSRIQMEEELRAFHSLGAYVLLGVLLHLIPTVSVGAHRWYIWYLSPIFIFWIIVLGLVIDGIERLVTRRMLEVFLQGMLMVGGGLAIIVSACFFVVRLDYRNPLYVARYKAARWMAANLPPDAVCASWNAGQIGFFSERTVINMDGLINGIDYYNRVIRGDVSRLDYVYENGVGYLVDYKLEKRVPQKFPSLLEVPIRDESGERVQVWQVLAPNPTDGQSPGQGD
jgi:hypothetical protein